MSPIGRGSHWAGPLLGDRRSFGGNFFNIPVDTLSRAGSKYKVRYEDFANDVATAAVLATLGWTVTAVGIPAANAAAVNKEGGFLLLDAGTTADTGDNYQLTAAVAAAAVSGPHESVGPQTSTITLMDDRELYFSTRIGYAQAAGRWAAGTGSKFVIGWLTADAALMTPTDGTLTVATGGGIFFHVTEAGALNFVTQRTTTPVTTTIRTRIDDATSATVVGNFLELGFRAVFDDADAAGANGFVEAYLNGQRVATHVNSLPMSSTETYGISCEVVNGPAASPNIDLGIDYLFTAISRPGVLRQVV